MPSEPPREAGPGAAEIAQAARPTLDEAIPAMSDKDLAALHANALRLAASSDPKRRAEAQRLLPLIEAELEKRRAKAPAPRARKTAARPKTAIHD